MTFVCMHLPNANWSPNMENHRKNLGRDCDVGRRTEGEKGGSERVGQVHSLPSYFNSSG